MRVTISMALLAFTLILTASACWAGIPVASTSTLWADPDTSTVGDTVDVYIIVRDVYGEPIPDISCDFFSDRGDSDIVIGSPDVTDIDGLAQARVSRNINFWPSTPRTSHLSADCDGVVIGPTNVVWYCLAGVDGGPSGGAALYPNSPNPFRAATEIRYTLASAGSVSLAVYDIAGRKVRALVAGALEPGEHAAKWDGRDDAGREATSGVYYVRMTAPGFDRTQSLILVR